MERKERLEIYKMDAEIEILKLAMEEHRSEEEYEKAMYDLEIEIDALDCI